MTCHMALVTRLFSQGYKVDRLSNTYKMFYGRHTDLVGQYKENVIYSHCYSLTTFTCYLDLSNFISESGLWYFRVLTICLLLVYFVNAAGCHCFDLFELDGFLCMVDHWSPRLPEILQFLSLASLHSKFERHIYIQNILEVKLGPSSHFFIKF